MSEMKTSGKRHTCMYVWRNSSEGRDGLDMCKGEIKMRPREIYYNYTNNSRWNAKSKQTKAEMARPGERG